MRCQGRRQWVLYQASVQSAAGESTSQSANARLNLCDWGVQNQDREPSPSTGGSSERQKLAEELVSTEKTYQDGLRAIFRGFVFRLHKVTEGTLSPSQQRPACVHPCACTACILPARPFAFSVSAESPSIFVVLVRRGRPAAALGRRDPRLLLQHWRYARTPLPALLAARLCAALRLIVLLGLLPCIADLYDLSCKLYADLVKLKEGGQLLTPALGKVLLTYTPYFKMCTSSNVAPAHRCLWS